MTAHKRVSQYGKRWDARVPRSDIAWLVGRLHVSESNESIAADIRSRCTAPGYTESIIRQSIAYALICHARNRGLYQRVMRGSVGA